VANPEECKKCHGQDLQGGISGVSCSKCHPGYPHPTGWAQPLQHGSIYGANPQYCQKCHGADYRGGTSLVSCINEPTSPQPTGCHPNPASIHTANWKDVDHGKAAKSKPLSSDPFASFFTCQNCHGANFTGTALSNQKNCFSANSCHFHPEGMPHDAWNGISFGIVYTHTDTAVENAPVCYQCHNRDPGPHNWYDATGTIPNTIGNMLTPLTGNPDPNATPGCFNNTLCHGQKP
jgi:hypothetical protein